MDAAAGTVAEAEVTDLSPAALLALARQRKADEDRAAADILDLAATWADLHPPESIHTAATFTAASFTAAGSEREEPLAGEGCPLVAEHAVAELGAVLGLSTTAAKRLVGHALELRHRLPRLWDQVHHGTVPAWRARLVAEATIHTTPSLTREAAGWVDTQVAAVAGRVGTAQLDRLVAEAITRHGLAVADPAADPVDGYLAVDPRHVTIHDQDVHYAGTIRIDAEIGLADALDLDRALTHRAATLAALGSAASLDARRALALGDLARTQTALDLHTSSDGTTSSTASPELPAARQVVLHTHLHASLTDATLTADGTLAYGPTGRLDNGQRLVLLDHIRTWCADSRTHVVIKPVIDLNTEQSTPAYAIPDRIREHVILRDRTCVFPWCTRPARSCDIDHITPYDHHAATDADADGEGRPQPGPTTTANLAALCRTHHRLKTHTPWRYHQTAPGVFEWTSPHGHHYHRDHSGTTTLDPPIDPPPASATTSTTRPAIPRQRRPAAQPAERPAERP